jgi:predicted nucleotidyltransferase
VRAAAPALLPVFRSRLQGVLLALVLGHPDREWTLEELASSSREPYQTVGNEVRRLQGAGLATVRTVGRSKFLRANTASPYFGPLAQLVLMSFGPPLIVSEELATLPGVDQVFIYGSWAARYAGEPGPAPNDVDVLLVGAPDRDEAYEAAARAQQRLGREVNVTIRSVARWDKDQDGFTVQLRSSPLLLVPPPPVADGIPPAAQGNRGPAPRAGGVDG